MNTVHHCLRCHSTEFSLVKDEERGLIAVCNNCDLVATTLTTEPPKRTLITDLWHFIENCQTGDPDWNERFFALRERVRSGEA